MSKPTYAVRGKDGQYVHLDGAVWTSTSRDLARNYAIKQGAISIIELRTRKGVTYALKEEDL